MRLRISKHDAQSRHSRPPIATCLDCAISAGGRSGENCSPRRRIIGALDTGCRRGEMMKIRNKHVDWEHRWIRILKENSKTEVARIIPFDRGSRLEEVLRRRTFLGPDAYVFGHAKTGDYVGSFRS